MRNVRPLTEKDIYDIRKSLTRLSLAKHRKTGLPFVTLKYAQTLDGKIATVTGDSRWISGPSSRRLTHTTRSCHDAILVGVNTILRDDPLLTVRLVEGKSPQKVILDSRLRTPLDSRVLRKRSAASTIIATTSLAGKRKADSLRSKGAQVWTIRKDSLGRVDLGQLLQKLGESGIRSILVEGGSGVITSFLSQRLMDHLLVFIAPKILGSGLRSVNPTATSAAAKLRLPSSARYFTVGEDIVLQTFLRA